MNFRLTEFSEVRPFVLHMVRKASCEMVGVFVLTSTA